MVNLQKSNRLSHISADDARLHSAPTYVHCKAGKSRSVTAVMAYLIHANHWPLQRAYAFAAEKRKGISPNIGFMSELMNFEEQELGGKGGVIANGKGSNNEEENGASGTANYGQVPVSRRPAHLGPWPCSPMSPAPARRPFWGLPWRLRAQRRPTWSGKEAQ